MHHKKLLSVSGLDITEWTLALELDGASVFFRIPEVVSGVHEFSAGSLRWQVHVSFGDNALHLQTTLVNSGIKAIRLGRATLLQCDTLSIGDAEDSIVVLPWQTGQFQQRVYRLGDAEDPGMAKIKAQFYNQTKHKAVQIGFLTFQRANTEVHYHSERGRLQSLYAWCDFAGWQLQPGTSTDTETLRLAWGDDPYQQMEDWAEQAADIIKPNIWQEPPIGYLGWAWTDPINGSERYDEVTLANLDAINQRLGGFGVRYLWTSMTNIKGGLPGNWLQWNQRHIPMGRELFITEVEKRGFIPGLWIGPFYIANRPELVEAFGDALLCDKDGAYLVVVPTWSHGDAGCLPKEQRPCLYALDPTHPKSLAFIRQVFQTYRNWGVRYYMVDFLEAGAGTASRFPYKSHYDERQVAGPEAYLVFVRAIREAAGDDTYLLGSSGPTMINAGVLDAVRTGSDFGEGRPLSPGTFFYPGTYVINKQTFWTGARYALMNHAANFHTHRRFYLNDSGNVLTVDKPLSLAHARLHATIHAFSGCASMLGDDLRHIADDRLSLIKKTLPRSVELARPIDLFDAPHPQSASIFWRRINTAWQTYDLVIVYNLTTEPRYYDLDLTRFGLSSEHAWLVWAFWDESFIGSITDRLRIWVGAETVRVFRLTQDFSKPTLIGTDMHLTMGEMDLLHAHFDEATMTFHLEARRPAGETGMAFVRAPDNLYVINFDGLHVAKDGRDQSLLIGVPLTFGETCEAQCEIRFGLLEDKRTVNTI